MHFDLITLFPNMIKGFIEESIIKRAIKNKIININIHNLRKWAKSPNYKVDDRPFGGGAGMLIKPEPLFKAVNKLKTKEKTKVIFLSPDGLLLNNNLAKKLSLEKHLILISGHYEGIDQRVRDQIVDEEISIGEYILTNGTLASAVLIDTIIRYIPGILGSINSINQDSFNNNLLSYPQYTRPSKYKNNIVPEVLLSGNHELINLWRKNKQIEKTLLKKYKLKYE